MESGTVITSVSNPLIKRISKLDDAKYRRAEGLFLCEGIKLVSEALAHANVEYIFIEESSEAAFQSVARTACDKGAKVFYLSETAFSKISTEKAPQGVIAAVRTDIYCDPATAFASKSIFIVDGIRDPGNLGTIIRTAGALGIEALFISDCANVTNPKAIRASMGGIFRTKLCSVDNVVSVIEDLKKQGRRVFATALQEDSLALDEFSLKSTDVFVVGNEGHGLSSETIDACTDTVIIRMRNDTESFNVSVASSLLMWELSKTF